jgi:hypothetical protein
MHGRPDFLIAGAPKCGTTSMHHYLRAHPEIFVPYQKEPNFFSSDVRIRKRLSEGEYLELFGERRDETVVGEVSIWYVYSRRAARAIHDLCGPIRIVAMLRNPLDAMHSLHSQFVYTGDEDIEDFGEALAAEPARLRGERVPEGGWKGAECLCYRRVFDFPEQLERFHEVFGRERVHVVLLEELARDPRPVLGDLCAFLGVEPRGEVSFGRVNPNKRVGSPLLRDLHRRYDRGVRGLAKRLIPATALRRKTARVMVGGLRGLYTRYEERAPIDPDLRRRLAEEVEPSIVRLERLLGRSLEAWRSAA